MKRLLLVCLTAGLWADQAFAQLNTSPSQITGLSDLVTCVTATHDGRKLAWGDGHNQVGLLDFPSGKLEALLTGHTGIVSCVAFSPDALLLASGAEDKTVRLWDLTTDKSIAELLGHTEAPRCVAFSPDSKTLVSAAPDGKILLWDVATHKQKAVLKIQADYVVTFSPDGKTLALDHGDEIVLWDLTADQEAARYKENTKSSIRSLVFRPDGQMLACGFFDGAIHLWDRTTGTRKATLPAGKKPIYALCFSSDGTTLASGSADQTVKLWDVAAAKEKTPGVFHDSNAVAYVSFTADNTVLLAAAYDLTITKWNPVSGKEIAHEQRLSAANGAELSNAPPGAIPPPPKPTPTPFLFGLSKFDVMIFVIVLVVLLFGALALGRRTRGGPANKPPSL